MESNKNMLKYSVALCTYNGSKYIKEQLVSILNQTVRPSQIVVSDDGSKDNTKEIVKTVLSDSGIDYVVVDNTQQHGVTPNFQNAISLCKHPIIFTSDQDDVWTPFKAEEMLSIFESNPQALLVFSDGELVDENMNSMQCSLWTSLGIRDSLLEKSDWFHVLIRKCMVTGAAMAFKRELYDEIGSIPKEWLHDGWLTWMAVSKKGLYPCNKKLFYYRQHKDNVVGALPLNSYVGHFRHYLGNFKKMNKWREIRYRRYEVIDKEISDRFTESQRAELKECIGFWKSLFEMKDKNAFQQLKVIFSLYHQGLYHKYYTGYKGMLRDVILAF